MKGEIMQGFNVAPICGYLTGPQDLGTVAEMEKGAEKLEIKPKHRKNKDTKNLNVHDYALLFGNKHSGFSFTEPAGTTITIGKTKCFAPAKDNGKIAHCVTQITNGTELVQDATGTRVQQSEYQKIFGKGAIFINGVAENEVFTSAAQ